MDQCRKACVCPASFPWDCTVIGPSKGKWSEGGGQSDGEGREGERVKACRKSDLQNVFIHAQLFATKPSNTYLLTQEAWDEKVLGLCSEDF